MGFFIGLLTFVLVLNCLFLILLVLIQLPKKEAGAGLAFGGGATDALFGAGTGTVLTRVTKYCTALFFVLTIGLGLLQSAYHRRSTREFQQQLQTQTTAPLLPESGTPLPAATTTPTGLTNAPAAPEPTAPAVTPQGTTPSGVGSNGPANPTP